MSNQELERNPSQSIETDFHRRLVARVEHFGIVPAEQLRTTADRVEQYDRLERAIGNTPLLAIPAANNCTIWVKVESENPFSESHYDRAAVRVLRTFEEGGFIKPGDTILEATSGSAGRAFAVASRYLGYGLDIVVPHPDEIPQERLRDMRVFGANVIHADGKGGIMKAISKERRILAGYRRQARNGIGEFDDESLRLEGKPIIFYRNGGQIIVVPNHAEIPITPRAFEGIAKEAVKQLPEGTRIDTFVSTLGNGSTLKGITDVLDATYGRVRTIGVETQNAPTNTKREVRERLIARGGFPAEAFEAYNKKADDPEAHARLREEFLNRYGFTMPEKGEMSYHDSFGASTEGYEPPFIDVNRLDGIIVVGNEWRDFKRRMNTYAYLLGNQVTMIGNTSAENLYVAHKLAELEGRAGQNFFILFYDKADQYVDWPPQMREYRYPLEQPKPDQISYSLRRIVDETKRTIPQKPMETMLEYVNRVYNSGKNVKAS